MALPSGGAGKAEPPEVLQAAWREVLDVLQAEVSGPTFNNYLRHIRPLHLSGDRLTLSAASDFVKDWLVRRFAKRIEETLEQFLGRPVLLAFQIAPSETAKSETTETESTPAWTAPERQAAENEP